MAYSDTASNSYTKPSKTVFAATALCIFVLALSAADSVDFVPNYIDRTPDKNTSVDTQRAAQVPVVITQSEPAIAGAETAVEPARIRIAAIGLDLPVQNPDTRDIHVLDELLKAGPARYVDSAKLGEAGGNMIIFAHSSNLPVVHNQMYKAFNRIKELKAGDTITLEAEGKRYIYSVTSIAKATASDTRIDMRKELGTRLTLVTCDTLTSKDARYVLEASFTGSYAL